MSHVDFFKPCILIPVYNHEHAMVIMAERLSDQAYPVLMVNDGSSEACSMVLRDIEKKYANFQLLELAENGGKGFAVKQGLHYANQLGFTHALQIDADGQHDINDINKFMDMGEQYATAIICGAPIFDETVPTHRFLFRYLTHVWIWINTLSLTIKDSMCGFRLYPVQQTLLIVDSEKIGDRMDFDPELVVHWVWRNYPFYNLPTKVNYPIDGVSHFDLLNDNVRITKMHTRLFFGMLKRFPRLMLNKIKGVN